MKDNFNTNTNNNDEWLTPPYITKELGPFDLDPCSPIVRPWDTAKNHYNINQNGLYLPWGGRVWLNPPYGKETFNWISKLADHKMGVALIFARTETIGFHKEIWEKANSVFFFKGRLRFYYVNGERGGTANAPSCLVSYSNYDTMIIEKSIKNNKIVGRLVKL